MKEISPTASVDWYQSQLTGSQYELIDAIKRVKGIDYGFKDCRAFVDSYIGGIKRGLRSRIQRGGGGLVVHQDISVLNFSQSLKQAQIDFGMKPSLIDNFEAPTGLLERANEIFEEVLVRWIGRYSESEYLNVLGFTGLPLSAKSVLSRQILSLQNKRLQDIIPYQSRSGSAEIVRVSTLAIEANGVTSATIGDEIIGTPRGGSVLRKLVRREPPFDELKYKKPYIAAINATHQVAAHAADIRLVTHTFADDKKRAALSERGVDLFMKHDEDIKLMGSQDANLSKVRLLNTDADMILEEMFMKNSFSLPRGIEGISGFREFIKNLDNRDVLIAKELLPYFTRYELGMSERFVLIGENATILPRISYFDDFEFTDVVKTFYPDVP